jgi:hypothetical protein
MVQTSRDALNSYGSQIDSILSHPDYTGITVSGNDIIGKTLSAFSNSEYTAPEIVARLKSQVPAQAKLITKLSNGELSLPEANTLRQAIDRVTYKMKIDSPEVRAGKELAEQVGNALRNEVQTKAPETAPIFSNYSKEINLQKALIKLQARNEKAGPVSMKELLGALGAGGLFGPVGAGAMLAGEKVAGTPMARVGAAKLIKAAQPLIKNAATIGKVAGAVAGKIPVVKK